MNELESNSRFIWEPSNIVARAVLDFASRFIWDPGQGFAVAATASREYCKGDTGGGIDPSCPSSGSGAGRESVGSSTPNYSDTKQYLEDTRRVFRGATDSAIGIDDSSLSIGAAHEQSKKDRGLLKKQVASDLAGRLGAAGFSEDNAAVQELRSMPSFEKNGSVGAGAKEGEEARYGIAAGVNDNWAYTSGDSSAISCGMQHAIAAEMGLSNAATGHLLSTSDAPKTAAVASNPCMRAVIRAQYEATQEHFKREGITELTLHRGYAHDDKPKPVGSQVDLELQPASSFSMSYDTAYSFARVPGHPGDGGNSPRHASVVTITVPVKHILSTAVTGMGCAPEQEVVVLSHPIRGTISRGQTYVGPND